MIRSPETTRRFEGETSALKNLVTLKYPQSYVDYCASIIKLAHQDYDQRLDLMEEQLRALPRDRRQDACQRLIRLGGKDCASGSLDYHNAEMRLVSMGITSPGGIYEHDRQLIAESVG